MWFTANADALCALCQETLVAATGSRWGFPHCGLSWPATRAGHKHSHGVGPRNTAHMLNSILHAHLLACWMGNKIKLPYQYEYRCNIYAREVIELRGFKHSQ
ncbi:hypothetical protein BS47DRAFT_872409 [Hydnum rufescens UP504]|uniref:Uncharacterized protein n=1 Tax=Hydnum rufescens UP504 TaxID=1448309 RepID=A0A9P6AYP4_9AGAM|nr:hypothetical protein BS47DRAFT_872409 [Hydnum rufescens UP504]